MRVNLTVLVFMTIFLGSSTSTLAVSDSVLALTSGNREFAVSLYKNLASEKGNLFLSPHSISEAMAMTFAGARGDTESQIKTVMHYPFSQDKLHPAFGELENALAARGKEGGVELLTANSLWPHERFTFLDSFLEIIRSDYQSDVFPVDFGDAEPVRLQINGWVEGKTRDKIKNLIPPGVLNDLTRMVLVNAVYFLGDWKTTFSEELTANRPFTLASGEATETPTMYGKIPARFAAMPDANVLELPYKNESLVMTVVLPNEPSGLADLESSLTSESFDEWDKALRQDDVLVYLPKFSLTAQFGLNKTLAELGMPHAFDEGLADFSGMDGNEHNLFISAVIHKAFVDVNEKGTEAAAATAVIMQARAMPKPSPEFRADHPFLFFIKDKSTQSILFMGRFSEPPMMEKN